MLRTKLRTEKDFKSLAEFGDWERENPLPEFEELKRTLGLTLLLVLEGRSRAAAIREVAATRRQVCPLEQPAEFMKRVEIEEERRAHVSTCPIGGVAALPEPAWKAELKILTEGAREALKRTYGITPKLYKGAVRQAVDELGKPIGRQTMRNSLRHNKKLEDFADFADWEQKNPLPEIEELKRSLGLALLLALEDKSRAAAIRAVAVTRRRVCPLDQQEAFMKEVEKEEERRFRMSLAEKSNAARSRAVGRVCQAVERCKGGSNDRNGGINSSQSQKKTKKKSKKKKASSQSAGSEEGEAKNESNTEPVWEKAKFVEGWYDLLAMYSFSSQPSKLAAPVKRSTAR